MPKLQPQSKPENVKFLVQLSYPEWMTATVKVKAPADTPAEELIRQGMDIADKTAPFSRADDSGDTYCAGIMKVTHDKAGDVDSEENIPVPFAHSAHADTQSAEAFKFLGRLLTEQLDFDHPHTEINGADLVEYIADLRTEIKEYFKEIGYNPVLETFE
jgi:hypothetical protein